MFKYRAAATVRVADTQPTGRTKRALRALVADRDRDAPSDVVDEAAGTLSDVETATRFLASDGTARLARAVVRAVRDGDEETVRRGREMLAVLHSLQSALGAPERTDGATADRDQSTATVAASTELTAVRNAPRRSVSLCSRNGFTGRWQTRG